MGARPIAWVLAGGLMAWAQGTAPRKGPSDYPASAALSGGAVAAEYMVHSFSGRGRTYLVKDHLVVESAVFPEKGERLHVAHGHFTLRVNGARRALLAETPAWVAASLKYPDWERRPTLTAGAGVGDSAVILGPPSPRDRFPGDPRPGQTRLPAPPRAPGPQEPGGLEKEEPARPEELLMETALPEGEATGPVSGFLYFPYKGKAGKVRSLELLYNGSAGQATLRLR